MLLEFLGAAHEVTGSCHFLQYENRLQKQFSYRQTL